MELLSFAQPMHPKADHNYTVDFGKLFDGLGGNSIVGTPTITIEDPVEAERPGFTVQFVSLDADAQKVIFNADVDSGDEASTKYDDTGVEICILVTVQTANAAVEPQAVKLRVARQC